jgi:hypothetical protein
MQCDTSQCSVDEMGPHDYGRPERMTEAVQTHPVAEQERRLREQFPGWQVWAERTIDGVTLWHAAPAGVPYKVIADMTSAPKLAEAMAGYMAALPRHLADVRLMLTRDAEAAPRSGMDNTRRANLTALRDALDALSGRLDAS